MFDLQHGNKFRLKDFSILSRTNSEMKCTASGKCTAQHHLSSLKSAVPNGEITIDKETVDKIFIEEKSIDYPGALFIYEWMIEEHIAG